MLHFAVSVAAAPDDAVANTPRSLSLPWFPALRNGHAAAGAEGHGGDLKPDRGLPALVLGEVDEAGDAADRGLGELGFADDAGEGLALLDVALDDGVEVFVRGEGVLVFLVGAELSAWGLGDAAFGDRRGRKAAGLPVGVHPVREAVDL